METELGAEHFEEKLEQMVALYQLPLLRLCYAYLHDEELAKDAVQETFLKAYRALPAFRKEASEKAWLNRIAINTCKDIRRSGWFRHVDRRITPDKLPEAAAPVRQSDLNLTVEIMKAASQIPRGCPAVLVSGLDMRRGSGSSANHSSGCQQPFEARTAQAAHCYGRM